MAYWFSVAVTFFIATQRGILEIQSYAHIITKYPSSFDIENLLNNVKNKWLIKLDRFVYNPKIFNEVRRQ